MRFETTLPIAALALLSACASSPVAVTGTPEPVRTPALELGREERRLLAALIAAEDRTAWAAGPIGEAAAHSLPFLRSRAALAAARIGSEQALPLLLGLVSDADSLVRAEAAFGLGELGDTTAAAVDALVDGVRDAAVPVRIEAIGALGRLRAGREALHDVLGAPACEAASRCPRASVVAEALLAIWRLPRTAASASLARTHLGSPDAQVRWRAAYALMRMADPGTVEALIPATRDAEHLVRALAVRGLRRPVVDSGGARQPAVASLVQALGDSHPHVRINAVRALATFGDPALAASAAPLLQDADANVAIAAAEALADIGGAVDDLATIAADATRRTALRAAALGSLLRLDVPRALPLLTRFARSDSWLQRLYAARVIARGAWADVAAVAGPLTRDADPRVAGAALESVVALTSDTIQAGYAFFLEGLAAPDIVVRAAALRGLEAGGDPADLPHLMQAYERAALDTVPDAALAALDALAVLAQNGVPVTRSFYLRFPPHADPLVRARAAERLGNGWQAQPAEPAPRVDYLALVETLVAPALAGAAPPRVVMRTAAGDIVLELDAVAAPRTVANFLALARAGYFEGTRWHRVVPNFVLQDGDPRGDGSGGPGYAIRDEMNRNRYLRGTVGMALAGPDTGGSQFFVTHSPQPHLDGGYTVFGRVLSGMEVADRVVQDDPITAVVPLQ